MWTTCATTATRRWSWVWTIRGCPLLAKPGEDKLMEDETAMVIGKKQYPILGHFPPTPSDPVLRLIFPRAVKTTDKQVVFRLYLPGLNFPEREAVFEVKDLMYRGKLEM